MLSLGLVCEDSHINTQIGLCDWQPSLLIHIIFCLIRLGPVWDPCYASERGVILSLPGAAVLSHPCLSRHSLLLPGLRVR